MSCRFSRETLALYVEGDLTGAVAERTGIHLAACEDCRRFMDQLVASQAMVKSLGIETVDRRQCAAMRRGVMEIIEEGRGASGWFLWFERGIVLGIRRRSYAITASILIALVSVSALAYVRDTAGMRTSRAVFEGRNTLVRPQDYRSWVLVGRLNHGRRSGDGQAGEMPTSSGRVYVDPSSYREYAKTGRFPEGTVMIWESAGPGTGVPEGPHKSAPVLLASVKDNGRFEEGWGFFDFTNLDGTPAETARALPDSSGCRSCHRLEEDHGFTQISSLPPSAHSVRSGPSSGQLPSLAYRG